MDTPVDRVILGLYKEVICANVSKQLEMSATQAAASNKDACDEPLELINKDILDVCMDWCKPRNSSAIHMLLPRVEDNVTSHSTPSSTNEDVDVDNDSIKMSVNDCNCKQDNTDVVDKVLDWIFPALETVNTPGWIFNMAH